LSFLYDFRFTGPTIQQSWQRTIRPIGAAACGIAFLENKLIAIDTVKGIYYRLIQSEHHDFEFGNGV